MNEQIHGWLYGMLYSGAICGLLLYICPGGKIRELAEVGAVCVMLLAFLSPLQQWRASYQGVLESFLEQQEIFEQELLLSGKTLQESLIAEEYAAYICNEAATFGLTVTGVEVVTEADESGNPLPREIRYYSNHPIPTAFQEHIAGQLGVAAERQYTYEK